MINKRWYDRDPILKEALDYKNRSSRIYASTSGAGCWRSYRTRLRNH